jgi:uncharacterized cupredoxin-like copper-binding protein
MTRRSLVMLVAALAAGLVPACANRHSGVRTVDLDIRHSRFSTAALVVRRGEAVRFVVHNHDPIAHELIVGGHAVQDRHESGTEAHHADRPGEVSVGAAATGRTTYTFRDAGRLFFGCHLPGHWAYGMHGTVDVR